MTDFTTDPVRRQPSHVVTRNTANLPALRLTRVALQDDAGRWTRAGILVRCRVGRYAFQFSVAAARKDNA